MRNVSDKNCTENLNTFYVQLRFFRKLEVYEIKWEKYCRAGRATDGNMAHAHCMLDTQATNKNTHCVMIADFFTAKMVAGTRLNITLYAHGLCC